MYDIQSVTSYISNQLTENHTLCTKMKCPVDMQFEQIIESCSVLTI